MDVIVTDIFPSCFEVLFLKIILFAGDPWISCIQSFLLYSFCFLWTVSHIAQFEATIISDFWEDIQGSIICSVFQVGSLYWFPVQAVPYWFNSGKMSLDSQTVMSVLLINYCMSSGPAKTWYTPTFIDRHLSPRNNFSKHCGKQVQCRLLAQYTNRIEFNLPYFSRRK